MVPMLCDGHGKNAVSTILQALARGIVNCRCVFHFLHLEVSKTTKTVHYVHYTASGERQSKANSWANRETLSTACKYDFSVPGKICAAHFTTIAN
jgi:hypothetical protein